MNLSRFVSISITRALRALSRRGFGTIMLAGYHTAWADRSVEFTSADDMVTAGLAELHPLVLAARAVEAQTPRVRSWKVGKRLGAPTQIIRLVPLLTTEGTIYAGTVRGEAWTYTVPAATALPAICTAIAAAINGLTASVAVTADGTSATFVECTNDAAGTWFAYTLTSDVDTVTVEDRTAEPATTLATDLAAIQAFDADFYGLVVVDAGSQAQIEAVAAWAAGKAVIALSHTMDSEVESALTTDVATSLKTLLRDNAVVFYSRANHGTGGIAGIAGKVLALAFGTEFAFPTWQFKSVSGLLPDALSEAAIGRLIGTPQSPASGKCAMIYATATPTGTNTGTPITIGGMTAGGVFIDDLQGIDYLTARLAEASFSAQIASPKIPYTAMGISKLEGIVRSVLQRLSRKPFNVIRDDFTTDVTAIDDTAAEDRAARYYDGVEFNATTQGAIHSIVFGGTVAP